MTQSLLELTDTSVMKHQMLESRKVGWTAEITGWENCSIFHRSSCRKLLLSCYWITLLLVMHASIHQYWLCSDPLHFVHNINPGFVRDSQGVVARPRGAH